MDKKNLNNSFNAEAFRISFLGDEDIMYEVIQSFLQTLPNMVQEIEIAILSKNADKLRVSAHTLKGSVANFYAIGAQEALFELEELGKNNQFENVVMRFTNTKEKLEELRSSLQQFLSTAKAA